MGLLTTDPRQHAESFDNPAHASVWANDLAEKLWRLGGSQEAKTIRRALAKSSAMIHSALYWKPRINLARVVPDENRLAFNDMNLVLFNWMDRQLCKYERSNTSITGPRESGKTLLTVEIAPVYGGLPALEKEEVSILHQAGILTGWEEETVEGLMIQWVPYTVIISDTEQQATRHLGKVKDHLTSSSCLLRWDWPDICRLERGVETTRPKEASKAAVEFKAGMRLEAYGIKTGILGSRFDVHRPHYAIMDDIEPGIDWSPESALARMEAIKGVVLPLSRILRSMLIATPQTEYSIAHIMALQARGKLEITEEYKFVHEWSPIVIEPWREDGQTFWQGHIEPARLKEEERKSTWGISYNSDPDTSVAVWWVESLFRRVKKLPSNPILTICFIDPKRKEKSKRGTSRAAYAFVSWCANEPFYVCGGGYSTHVGLRLAGDVLEAMVESRLTFHYVLYEDTVVGDSLGLDFRDAGLGDLFGIDAFGITPNVNKEIRAQSLLSIYTGTRIVHLDSPTIMIVERGLLSYKGGTANSDMVDAVGGGTRRLAEEKLRGIPTASGKRRPRNNHRSRVVVGHRNRRVGRR